jgi:hypothetical protein
MRASRSKQCNKLRVKTIKNSRLASGRTEEFALYKTDRHYYDSAIIPVN